MSLQNYSQCMQLVLKMVNCQVFGFNKFMEKDCDQSFFFKSLTQLRDQRYMPLGLFAKRSRCIKCGISCARYAKWYPCAAYSCSVPVAVRVSTNNGVRTAIHSMQLKGTKGAIRTMAHATFYLSLSYFRVILMDSNVLTRPNEKVTWGKCFFNLHEVLRLFTKGSHETCSSSTIWFVMKRLFQKNLKHVYHKWTTCVTGRKVPQCFTWLQPHGISSRTSQIIG